MLTPQSNFWANAYPPRYQLKRFVSKQDFFNKWPVLPAIPEIVLVQ
jgi:hypothetical protein